jgi:hypothetical protein
MRQELAFLAHLTRLVGQDAEPGYRPDAAGADAAPSAASAASGYHRILDLQA